MNPKTDRDANREYESPGKSHESTGDHLSEKKRSEGKKGSSKGTEKSHESTGDHLSEKKRSEGKKGSRSNGRN
ncbi:hypothetical protein DEO72_LG11g164 [Vigna unguiculata]|uniref:Uncharacterized protein n=1 Tax=Vigna unguiculata TaxID=3917 RepID=A0A4D6NJR5_VIGUN|nr:hypothetical protein DEO72_LG11g164 [Vigna unguiculata]